MTTKQTQGYETDFRIGGRWGCHITFVKRPDLTKPPVRVYGHMPNIPKPGDTLCAEFQETYVKFIFDSVEWQMDPTDMFFADVVPVAQMYKDGTVIVEEKQPSTFGKCLFGLRRILAGGCLQH